MDRDVLVRAIHRERARMVQHMEDVAAALAEPGLRLLRPWHANSVAHEIRKTGGALAQLMDELADLDRKTAEEEDNG